MKTNLFCKEKIKNRLIFLVVGGVGYTVIELIWRGKSHWTMALAGGVCFLCFSEIAKALCDKPLILKAALASLIVTAVELGFGLVVNKLFKRNVWDYSDKRFNFLGQICPLYSLLWIGLSALCLPLADYMNKMLEIS